MKSDDNRLVNEDFSLAAVDLSERIEEDTYAAEEARLQTELKRIQQAYLHTGERALVVFEGCDAAGKGGTIRRMAGAMDPRGFKVWPIGAPSPAEQRHHYLHRFWSRLPAAGEIVVFDRSWYGRVLVERVEDLATEAEWRRAYGEIVAFERMLRDDGARFVKIFLHISQKEQRKRFIERLRDPLKRWKLSYEDLRNREKWPHYETAVEDMVRSTSTARAPWAVISSEQKKSGRIKALQTIVDTLSHGVDLSPRPLDLGLLEQAESKLGIDPRDVVDT
ncbi:polyphosphate kinase 2 family protein [Salinarimonas rosea]|uniref:polyphosphate kinase 2 family protein n=1 Tax=Salinarimonas rosea TaxID=552063 RepID=UPI0005BDAE07|nr:polyphosphate kinase [Salinarimonas rosea]